MGNRHQICDACRYGIKLHAAQYRKKRILNGARSIQRVGNTADYKLVGGHVFIDATGTRRRLQALAVMGWGWAELGRRLGQEGTNIGYTARIRNNVYPETAAKIKAIYDELSMLPAPVTRANSVVRTRARAKGWLPPLAWDDETMDDPYTLPMGLTVKQLWDWYCNTAREHERIEWVLEHGVPKNPKGGK